MRKLSPLPPELANSAFTAADARQAGLSKDWLRGRGMVSLGRGIRAPRDLELDLAGLVRPYTRFNAGTAASHDTAARLWGFPAPERRPYASQIHVLRAFGCAEVKRDNVVGHRARILAGETVWDDGLCVTTRERTWLDLAESLTVDDLVVIADHLVRIPRPEFEDRTEPYATVDSLARLLAGHRGKRGIRKARAALELCRIGADSPPETRLRLALHRAGLPEPLVNAPLMDAGGRILHSPDLSYPEFRVAVEYEGAGHSHPDQIDRDIGRAERVAAAGWIEVRISKRHMGDDARLAVRKVSAALIAQGWRPGAASTEG